MPTIDLTRLLNNPRYSDTFSVARMTEIVGTDGEVASSPTNYPSVPGVVVPQDSSILARTSDGSQITGEILVFTRFPLTASYMSTKTGITYEADTVTWHNEKYMVQSVDDWSGFGTGFVKATCHIATLNA